MVYGWFAVAHNGQLVNASNLKKEVSNVIHLLLKSSRYVGMCYSRENWKLKSVGFYDGCYMNEGL